jgi:hypothetical protein
MKNRTSPCGSDVPPAGYVLAGVALDDGRGDRIHFEAERCHP